MDDFGTTTDENSPRMMEKTSPPEETSLQMEEILEPNAQVENEPPQTDKTSFVPREACVNVPPRDGEYLFYEQGSDFYLCDNEDGPGICGTYSSPYNDENIPPHVICQGVCVNVDATRCFTANELLKKVNTILERQHKSYLYRRRRGRGNRGGRGGNRGGGRGSGGRGNHHNGGYGRSGRAPHPPHTAEVQNYNWGGGPAYVPAHHQFS
jgi:hypothetical protein